MTKQLVKDPIADVAVRPIPDFLGKAQRVATVGGLLADAQDQLLRLENVRVLNGQSWDDQVPPVPGRPTADLPTYGQRKKDLEDGIAALIEANGDIVDELAGHAARSRDRIERELHQAHS